MRRLTFILSAVALLLAPLPASSLFTTADALETPTGEATIVRDDFGVPHIFADSERALWYANGYVQAQDRLWAMDLLRHISYGEGASVVGPGGGILEMDLNTRRNLYDRPALEQQWNQAATQFQQVVRDFTDGVNRAAAEMAATGELPAEFAALNHAFEPWEPIDTVAVATFLLAEFGNGGGSEIDNAKLLAQLDATLGDGAVDSDNDGLDDLKPMDAFTDLNWVRSTDSYATIQGSTFAPATPAQGTEKTWSQVPDDQKRATEAAARAESFGASADQAGLGDLPGFIEQEIDIRLGSNALLVAPWLSESGAAMVGGGPQMGYFNPQVPWEVGLHLNDGSLEAVGIGVTGAPGVIIGRTANFAWTVTSGISDQTDIVALEADTSTSDDRDYLWDGTTRQLDCRTEHHKLVTPPALYDPASGQPPVNVLTQEVCRAELETGVPPAPVVAVTTDEDGEAEWFFAKKSSSRMLEVPSAIQWLSLDTKTDWDGFESVFEADPSVGSPGFAFTFNFHYAGVKADEPSGEAICYKHVGLQPMRNLNLDPRLPTPAGDTWAWQGFLTGNQLPNDCNPSKGYYAQWNNLPQHGWAAGDTRELWGSVHRVERLDKAFNDVLSEDIANDDGKLSLDQVQTILKEAATHDSLTKEIVDAVQLHFSPGMAPAAHAALADWQTADYPWDETHTQQETNEDGETVEVTYYDHAGHTVYDLLVEELLHQVFADELGDEIRTVEWDPREASDPHAGDHGQHRNEFSILVDALRGTTAEDWCDDITTTAAESCTDQVADALEATGLDQHATAADVPATEEHRSPFTSLGLGPAYTMPMTNRATFYHFHVGSDTSTSQGVLPSGTDGSFNAVEAMLILSGQGAPEHNRDQLELYVDFAFKDLPWTQADAEAGADSVTTLLVPP